MRRARFVCRHVFSRDNRIEVRWEPPLSQGDDVAVAAACMRRGLVDDSVTVQMPGGDLAVRRDSGGSLVQSGPARRVYRARVDLADFA